jgi:hypothetical protein
VTPMEDEQRKLMSLCDCVLDLNPGALRYKLVGLSIVSNLKL